MTDDRADATGREQRLIEILNAHEEAIRAGNAPDRRSLLSEHPDLARELAEYLDAQESLLRLTEPLRPLAHAVASDIPTSELFTQPVDGSTLPPGRRVGYFGDYELIDEIARGGMGVVYRARQLSLNRPVALKMILAGTLASEADVRRFHNEAEAVATLDHPGIVPIFEVGTHEGQSYLGMKLVEGGSLADRLPEYTADPRSAARLLAGVARAVHHAHQRGVLHRDLKPSNILVDRQGQPHVTDFGLARRVEGGSELTQSGAILGSPPYMAPEQTTGHRGAITTATDVYGLGAVLYAMLAGRPPFRADSVMETIDQVRRSPPEPPSGVNHRVDRDLQTVCLKCLDKDPLRRYASARELAEDVDRWLEGRPILARRAGRLEHAWRWARRNPVVAGLSGLVVLLSLGAVAGLAVSNRMISRRNAVVEQERDNARQAQAATTRALNQSEESRRQAEAVSRFLVDAFRRPDPSQDGKELLVVDLLGQAAAGLDGQFAGSPRIKGELLHALGQTYYGLGLWLRSMEIYEKAWTIRRAILGPDDPETHATMNNLALAYKGAGRLTEAVSLCEETLGRRKKILGTNSRDTLSSMDNLAECYRAAGRIAEALSLHEETLRLRKSILGANHPDTLTSMNNLALAYKDAGRTAEAISLLEETLRRLKATVGPDHVAIISVMHNLAGVYYQSRDRLVDALILFEEVLKLEKSTLGPDHPQTISTLNNLALAYKDSGRLAEALPLFEDASQRLEATLGPDHPQTLHQRSALAGAYLEATRLEDAIALQLETMGRVRVKLGPDHPQTLTMLYNLAATYNSAGRFADAVPPAEEAYRLRNAKLGPDHPDTIRSMGILAIAYREGGRLAEALPLLEVTLGLMKAHLGPDHPETLASMVELTRAYLASGRIDEAIPLGEEALRLGRAKVGPDTRTMAVGMGYLAEAYRAAGRLAEALPLAEESLRLVKAQLGPAHHITLSSMNNLAEVYRAAGRLAEALPLHEESFRLCKAKLGLDHLDTIKSMSNLAGSYREAGRPAEAEPLFRQTREVGSRVLGERHEITLDATHFLAHSLVSLGRQAEAGPLFLEALAAYHQLRGPEDTLTLDLSNDLLSVLQSAGQLDHAEPLLQELVASWKRKLGPDHLMVAAALAQLGLKQLTEKKHVAAELLLRECLIIRQGKSPDHWTRFNTESLLGGSLLGQGKYAEAEPLLVSGFEGMKAREATIPPAGRIRPAEGGERVVRLYEAWGRPEKANEWKARLGLADLPADVFARP